MAGGAGSGGGQVEGEQTAPPQPSVHIRRRPRQHNPSQARLLAAVQGHHALLIAAWHPNSLPWCHIQQILFIKGSQSEVPHICRQVGLAGAFDLRAWAGASTCVCVACVCGKAFVRRASIVPPPSADRMPAHLGQPLPGGRVGAAGLHGIAAQLLWLRGCGGSQQQHRQQDGAALLHAWSGYDEAWAVWRPAWRKGEQGGSLARRGGASGGASWSACQLTGCPFDQRLRCGPSMPRRTGGRRWWRGTSRASSSGQGAAQARCPAGIRVATPLARQHGVTRALRAPCGKSPRLHSRTGRPQ